MPNILAKPGHPPAMRHLLCARIAQEQDRLTTALNKVERTR